MNEFRENSYNTRSMSLRKFEVLTELIEFISHKLGLELRPVSTQILCMCQYVQPHKIVNTVAVW